LKNEKKEPAALRSLLDLRSVNHLAFRDRNEKIVQLCEELVGSLSYSQGSKIILKELSDATQNKSKPDLGQHLVIRTLLKDFHAKHMETIE
jgi:hypothetical protein